jgi:hypothetical protein
VLNDRDGVSGVAALRKPNGNAGKGARDLLARGSLDAGNLGGAQRSA